MIKEKECVFLIIECLRKKGLSPFENIGSSLMDLSEIDLCIDCVSDVLCNEGFDKNFKPNSYGLKLESVIDYLSHMRFSFVDDTDCETACQGDG